MEHGIGYFFGHIASSVHHYLAGTSKQDLIWVAIGLAGQCLFMMRFIVQWIHSERHQQSLIPVSFWYLSLLGGLIVLAYGIHRIDPVIILGQLPGTIVYARNLVLIKRHARKSQQKPH
ncbi:MAG TPA: lipid-A-disaccharide synthase N-terminal domain-containing protein [Methylophilus sp.]|nr:lipid-A-disaccharide synthase N-terminal domain-containing protein [Methylophilus sp.]HQQ32545.1 lipid-A-disaccharide synthase N-terminal domain-containing protein [Methylophilus sp.]